MGVAKAIEAGYDTIACSSTGNAASSLAGNAAAAGLKTYIFVPERAPIGKVAQLLIFGATVISVKGNYEETFELSKDAINEYGWYNRNAAINCYLMEGKKTVALEIAEQLGWKIPDYVALSVGDGCTIAGVWKGFKDLYEAGFTDKLPKLISVQSVNTCPINRAVRTGEPWEPMEENTLADSISVGVPRNADKAIAAIIESGGIPVEVGNDANVAALGEQWHGGGKGFKNVVMVTLGTGVGGGIIIGGRILAGSHGAGGEIGHIQMRKNETAVCGCGKKGCLEQYASATGIVRMSKLLLEKDKRESSLRSLAEITSKDIFDAAKTGDALSLKLVDTLGEMLGTALAHITAVVDPDVIVIGGGVSKAGQILIDAIEKHYRPTAFHACRNTQFKLAVLGNDAGMYGAVRMILNS